jgi:hypothetical protein
VFWQRRTIAVFARADWFIPSAKQGLIYLTANDWALVADKAHHLDHSTLQGLFELFPHPRRVFTVPWPQICPGFEGI